MYNNRVDVSFRSVDLCVYRAQTCSHVYPREMKCIVRFRGGWVCGWVGFAVSHFGQVIQHDT